MAMSVAANIATLPVVVWYFSDVSLVAVLSNILVVPFVNFLFIGSFFLALAGSIFPPVAIALGFLMGTLSNMILAAVRQIASFSYATIALPRPHTMVMVYYYLAVYSLWMLSQRKKVLEMKVLLSCVCFLAVSFCVIQYWNTDALRLEFINVGQGDSCMVRLPNRRHILIDTGEKGTGTTNNVVDYLKKRGIYTLDCVFISHADSDHSGGLAEVLDNIHVKKVALPELNIRSGDMEKLIQMIQQYQIPIDFVSAGDSYQIEELEIKALWPIALSGSSSLVTDNNLSMVLRMTYQDITAMFMGDLGGEAEEMLVHSGTPLLCTILKVSHHGSSTGTGEAFLNAAWPKYSVISVGENNYGHPDSEVVGRLESHGSQILRTDVLGNIVFHIDRKGELTAESR